MRILLSNMKHSMKKIIQICCFVCVYCTIIFTSMQHLCLCLTFIKAFPYALHHLLVTNTHFVLVSPTYTAIAHSNIFPRAARACSRFPSSDRSLSFSISPLTSITADTPLLTQRPWKDRGHCKFLK